MNEPIDDHKTITNDRKTTNTTPPTTRHAGRIVHPLSTRRSQGYASIDPQGNGVTLDESHPCDSKGPAPFMRTMRARAQTESWSERLPIAREHRGWRTAANCRGLQPDLMFPPPGNTPATRHAVECCNDCPARMSCLGNARTCESGDPNHDTFGVRGGLTASQRINIYNTMRVA